MIKGINGINVFKEYYPHEKEDCWKFLNPFTKYAEDKIVLGKVQDLTESQAIALKNDWFMNTFDIF